MMVDNIIDFLDHLMREYPSTKYTCFKRSFYDEKLESEDLHGGVIAYKGYYQALRATLVSPLSLSFLPFFH
jgi:eukaryotic translation initiation factor 2C